jgi:Flp pilus assembly protein CpaB
MGRSHEILGRTLRTSVARGQVFLINSLYAAGLGPSLADRLKPGERAVTVPFTGDEARAGLISPGAHVDVVFRTDANSRERVPETTLTLLENVRVLAVGQETFEGTVGSLDAQGTVTLAVTPVQARALGVVEGRGTLTLHLRNGDDSYAAGSAAPSTMDDLLGIRSNQPFETQIYRRGRLTRVIHGDGSPRYIHETPFGMPVAGQVPNPTDQSSLSTQAPTALAAHSSPWPAGANVNTNRNAGDQPASTEQTAVAE